MSQGRQGLQISAHFRAIWREKWRCSGSCVSKLPASKYRCKYPFMCSAVNSPNTSILCHSINKLQEMRQITAFFATLCYSDRITRVCTLHFPIKSNIYPQKHNSVKNTISLRKKNHLVKTK